MTQQDKPYYGEFSDDWARELQEDDRIEVVDIEDGEFGLDMGTKHVKFNIKNEKNLELEKSLIKIKEELNDLEEKYGNEYRTRHIWNNEAINFILQQKRNEFEKLETELNEIKNKMRKLQIEISLISAELTPKQRK